MDSLVGKAAQIAVIAHSDQKRKGSETQYVVHPISVAIKLAQYGFRDEVIAAALVHDVLEDTDFSQEELGKKLGGTVSELVVALSEPEDLEWEERKKSYIEKVRTSISDVKAVATADKINNLESFLDMYEVRGDTMWGVFTRGPEKQLWFFETMFQALKQSWSHPLLDEYEALLERFKKLV